MALLRMLVAIASLALLVCDHAEGACPNACSGHGDCTQTTCECYVDWQASDCSRRVCPSGIAFITTPRGDLNMDGDRYDNSNKLLVKQVGGAANRGTIDPVGSVLTLSTDVIAGELEVGDGIRVGNETFLVTGFRSSDPLRQLNVEPPSFTGHRDAEVFRFLETIDNPHGTWESWVGDYAKDAMEEGHYYMECSNQGTCDHILGQCRCFEGYTGAACHRQACPKDCSGHGTCETVRKLASLQPVLLGGFTVATTAGSTEVVPSANPLTHTYTSDVGTHTMSGIAVGDTIRVGSPTADSMVVASVSATSIVLAAVAPRTYPFGTKVYHVPRYDLWDSDLNRACNCDPGYHGDDCSLKYCPSGADPNLWALIANSTAASDKGKGSVTLRNEKQTIYLDTQRGMLSGTFKLIFTDPFGERWETKPISVNERLSSKAFVESTALDVVTFGPSLPHGALQAGDFLMIGDERQEVLTAYPVTALRPLTRGGVIDSVKVRNAFSAATTDIWPFRAGPARGIREALMAIPNGVVPDVRTEDFSTGTLIGYHRGGISSSAGMTDILGIQGNQAVAAMAGAATEGGLAPYDTIRVVGTGGTSEFLQLRNVDIYAAGAIEALKAKGTASAQEASTASLGLGVSDIGAIYRTGGYQIRVNFSSPSNSGNLPEMDVDESKLHSVFLREFHGTVSANEPSKVLCHLYGVGDLQFDATTTYPYPSGYADGSGDANGGDATTFKGDLADLKVMAGMRVKLGEQVRTVLTDIKSDSSSSVAYFYVDRPFSWSSMAETVHEVKYLFYRYPVEQIYDDATYQALTMSRALYLPTHAGLTASGTVSQGTAKYSLSAAIASGSQTAWQFSGPDPQAGATDPLNVVLPAGTTTTLTKTVSGTATSEVLTVLGSSATATDTEILVATQSSAIASFSATNAAYTRTNGAVFRIYDRLSTLASALSGAYGAPPLHRNYRTRWALVTDQRPLRWTAPNIALESRSRVVPSPTGKARRSVVAGGSGVLTFEAGSSNVLTAAATTLTLSGADRTISWLRLLDGAGTFSHSSPVVTISGCSANTGLNAAFTVSAVTDTVLTFSDNSHGVTGGSCAGDTITATVTTNSHLEGTAKLIDPRAVVLGDRIKLKRSIASYPGDYETRTVDHVWGGDDLQDVTLFSVEDPFSTTGSDFTGTDAEAWVDESGSTQSYECGNRGLCDRREGVCECFSGFYGNSCNEFELSL